MLSEETTILTLYASKERLPKKACMALTLVPSETETCKSYLSLKSSDNLALVVMTPLQDRGWIQVRFCLLSTLGLKTGQHLRSLVNAEQGLRLDKIINKDCALH